jgi:NADPH:quinone reductase-like Zn-dependent oxidoreductase
MAADMELPETMRVLVLKSPSSEPTVEIVPTPKLAVGSAVVRVLSASVLYYLRDMYLGKRPNSLPKPLIIGTSAIARVVALGLDATKLRPGDLAFVDIIIRSRDDETDVYLAGIHEGFSAGSRKLMTDGYRDWTYAEYCLTPLENLSLLDERRLLGDPEQGGLGYKLEDLNFLTTLLVPYGGLKDIELQAGQTVIVAPATDSFGGAAVLVALAMGARVIAIGRNTTSLANLKKKVPMPDRFETVQVTGDIAADCEELKKFGEIDAYFDIGPPQGYTSTHIKSCILALRHVARISLMGGYREDVALPHVRIM